MVPDKNPMVFSRLQVETGQTEMHKPGTGKVMKATNNEGEISTL